MASSEGLFLWCLPVSQPPDIEHLVLIVCSRLYSLARVTWSLPGLPSWEKTRIPLVHQCILWLNQGWHGVVTPFIPTSPMQIFIWSFFSRKTTLWVRQWDIYYLIFYQKHHQNLNIINSYTATTQHFLPSCLSSQRERNYSLPSYFWGDEK